MKKNDFAVLNFNSARIRDKYLVSNMLGAWDFLDADEFRVLHSFRVSKGSALFSRLRTAGIIADETNIRTLLEDYRRLNANLFNDTSLHIAVVTTRCNLGCAYCQTKAQEQADMTHEVAMRVLKYLFDVRSPNVVLSLIHI